LWEKCSSAGIEWKIGEAGLTAMMNLKNIAKSPEREVDVAARLMDEFAVSVAPSRAAFRSPEIGWFEVCFGAEEESLNKKVGPAREGPRRNQSDRQMLQSFPVPFVSIHCKFIEPKSRMRMAKPEPIRKG
jgi:hypothetical protein